MKRAMFITASFGLLAACGTAESNDQSGAVGVDEINLAQLEAEIEAPKTLDPGEEAELRVLVMQGDELVDDASEVTWEVWQAGSKEESEMIESDTPGEEGWYSITYEFEEEAVYHVQSHTTARGMHVMPVSDIVVGEPAEEEVEEAEDTEHADNMENHDHNENEDHGSNDHEEHSHVHDALHESITLEWNTPETSAGQEEVTISMDILWEEEVWENGDVRLEIWQHGDETRTWLETEESASGTYEKTFVPEEAGSYHIMVHLENEEVHEHVQYEMLIEEE